MSNKKIYAVDNSLEDKSAKFIDADSILGSNLVDDQEVSSTYTVQDKEEVRRANLYLLNDSSITVDYGGAIYVTDGICTHFQGQAVGTEGQLQVSNGLGEVDSANWSVNSSNSLIPNQNNAYDIGSATMVVRDLYLGPSSLNIASTGSSSDFLTISANGSGDSAGDFIFTGISNPNSLNSTTNYSFENSGDTNNLETQISLRGGPSSNYHYLRFKTDEGMTDGITLKFPDSPSSTTGQYLSVGAGSSGEQVNLVWTTPSSSGLNNVVEDTTPQLGGSLDLNSNDITGTGNVDITGDVIATLVKSNLEGAIHFNAQAAENILEGEVVYVSGLSGNTPIVSKARANSSTTMPAFGIASENINLNNTGNVVTLGTKTGLNVSNFGETGISFSLGDTLYVSSSQAGKITNVSPSGESNLIQNIGRLERVTPTDNISIKVGGAGRSNATPALNNGNIFIGDSNNRSVTSNLQSLVESYSINNIVEDATPQLGGDLDVNGSSIISSSNGDINISPNGTGSVVITSDIDMGTNSITDTKVGNWDTAYGWGDHSTVGYVTTDTNTFRTVVAGGNTLGSSETLTLSAGTNVSISESGGTVTISSTDTNTQLSTESVQDIVGAMVSGNVETNISVVYNDTTGKLNFSATDTNTFRTVVAGGNTLGSSETLTLSAGDGVTISESGGTVTISVSGSYSAHSQSVDLSSSDFTTSSTNYYNSSEYICWASTDAFNYDFVIENPDGFSDGDRLIVVNTKSSQNLTIETRKNGTLVSGLKQVTDGGEQTAVNTVTVPGRKRMTFIYNGSVFLYQTTA